MNLNFKSTRLIFHVQVHPRILMSKTSQYAQLQYPCLHPGCNCWFHNKFGLMQHQHARHPCISLSLSPLPSPPAQSESPPIAPDFPPPPNCSPTPHHDNRDAVNMDNEDFPAIESEYLGPHNAVFHNYHPHLSILKISTSDDFSDFVFWIVAGRPCDANGKFQPTSTQPLPLDMPPDDDWAPCNNQLEFELTDFLYSRNQIPTQQIDTLLAIWGDSLCRVGGQPLFKNHKDLYKTIDVIHKGDIKWQCFSLQYIHRLENEDHVA